MLRYHCKAHKGFREFFGDQLVVVLLVWLFSIPVSLIIVPFPDGAGMLLEKSVWTAVEWHLFLLVVFHVIGLVIIAAVISLAMVWVVCAVVWTSMWAGKAKEIPGSGRKIRRLTWKERLGRYYDYKECE
ncbi:MAG: hypothetical protein QME76_07200 [Bacillota bacterium]|nr:hypothetical protein [Bacillota bacterium]